MSKNINQRIEKSLLIQGKISIKYKILSRILKRIGVFLQKVFRVQNRYYISISPCFSQEALLSLLGHVKQWKAEGHQVLLGCLSYDTKIDHSNLCNDCPNLRQYQEEYKKRTAIVSEILNEL